MDSGMCWALYSRSRMEAVCSVLAKARARGRYEEFHGWFSLALLDLMA